VDCLPAGERRAPRPCRPRGHRLPGGYWYNGPLVLLRASRPGEDTPTLTNAFNVGIAASFHLPGVWDIVAEATPANRDVQGSAVAWSLGLNIRITGHDFLIYLGNSRATVTDMIAGSDIPGGFKASDVRLGFNLIRRFPE
jgi:hypothetical protein